MKVISQIASFDGLNLTNYENIGALDDHVFITDQNGNVINTLHNKILSLDAKTVDLNNLIYEDEEQNNIYVKNSSELIPNARINKNGTLYIRKINIANSDYINSLLEIEGVSNKGIFCWEINTESQSSTDSKFGLKNFSKSGNDWIISNDFIWNVDYQDNNSFWINKPTHILNGNFYLTRTDTAFPSINMCCSSPIPNDQQNMYFRVVINNDPNVQPFEINPNTQQPDPSKPIPSRAVAFQHIKNDTLNGLNYNTWTTFLFKNTYGDQRNVFFPQGIITLGSINLANTVSLQMRTTVHHKGIFGNTSGSFGLYDWEWTYSDDQSAFKTPWILRYNPNGQLVSERSLRVYNNQFSLGTIKYETSGAVGTNTYHAFINMNVRKDQDGEDLGGFLHLIGEEGVISSSYINCNTISPVQNLDNKPNNTSFDYNEPIILNTLKPTIYTKTIVKDSNDNTIPGQTRRISRYIPGTPKEDLNRICTISADKDNNNDIFVVSSQWGRPLEDNDIPIRQRNFIPSSSDIRLKENIQNTIENGLDLINQIQIRQFDWKDSHSHQKIGFIADEIEKIDSNLSVGGGYDKEGNFNTKSVNTFYLQAYEVKAIQELSQQVNTLKQQIEELKTLLKNK